MAALRRFVRNFGHFHAFVASGCKISRRNCFLPMTISSLNNWELLRTVLELQLKLQSRSLVCCVSARGPACGRPTAGKTNRTRDLTELSIEHLNFKVMPLPISKFNTVFREKHSKTRNTKQNKRAGSDSESSDSDEEFEVEQRNVEGDENLMGAPAEFSIRQVHLKTLRADSVVSVGLNIPRNKVDDLLYSTKLRLNGEKLLKKSSIMEVWDIVDLVTEVSEFGTTVRRVQVIKVDAQKTGKDKLSVWLRIWKKGFLVT